MHVFRQGKGEPIYDEDFTFSLAGAAGVDDGTHVEVNGNELRIHVTNPAMSRQMLQIKLRAP